MANAMGKHQNMLNRLNALAQGQYPTSTTNTVPTGGTIGASGTTWGTTQIPSWGGGAGGGSMGSVSGTIFNPQFPHQQLVPVTARDEVFLQRLRLAEQKVAELSSLVNALTIQLSTASSTQSRDAYLMVELMALKDFMSENYPDALNEFEAVRKSFRELTR